MRALLALLGAFAAMPAMALTYDASACKSEFEQEAARARAKYVQAFTPRVDPVQSFAVSTDACLAAITDFDVGIVLEIPNIDLDAILKNMAKQLLQRACQAATAQFNRAVGDALQAVNMPLADVASVPGFSAGISTGSAGVTIRDDGGATARRAADGTVDRIINLFR
ncbi:MAG: hypothetical protein BroJett001_31780 [Chloroflexota bacterium]|nr:MAG: hypothetical protein BroJett001_31780 [Chloroflexota bacterium]